MLMFIYTYRGIPGSFDEGPAVFMPVISRSGSYIHLWYAAGTGAEEAGFMRGFLGEDEDED